MVVVVVIVVVLAVVVAIARVLVVVVVIVRVLVVVVVSHLLAKGFLIRRLRRSTVERYDKKPGLFGPVSRDLLGSSSKSSTVYSTSHRTCHITHGVFECRIS